MYNKLKIIKYKITIYLMAIIFLCASFIIVYIYFVFDSNNIIKVNANIESIEYYEYGIIKKNKFANIVYSFNYSNKNIILTNSYLKYNESNFIINSKSEILYNSKTNSIAAKPRAYTLIFAFIFMFLSIVLIVFTFKLK